MTFSDQPRNPLPEPLPDEDQWFFQFQQHMLLTVQAIHRLHEVLMVKLP